MKKLIATLMTFVLFLCTPNLSWAENSMRFLQTIYVKDNSIVILTDNISEYNDISIDLGGQNLPNSGTTIGEGNVPITYFCLVDVSGTMVGQPLTLAKKVLTSLSNQMRPIDSMVIATFCNGINVSNVYSAGDELRTDINNLSIEAGDTSLYSTIIESIQLLSTSKDYNAKKCLIVLSDSIECQDNGATDAEVLQAVQQVNFPLYTFSILTSPSQLESGKILGSFSRTSAGGEHFTTAEEEGGKQSIHTDVNCDEIAEEICYDMESGMLLKADLSEFKLDEGRNEVTLKVVLTNGDTSITDTINISADDLPDSVKESTQETNLPLYTSTSEENITQQKDYTVLILCGSLLVIAIAVAAVVLLAKQKRDSKSKETSKQEFYIQPEYVQPSVMSGKSYTMSKNDIPIYMVEVPYGRQRVSFYLSSNGGICTVGRTNAADVVLNSSDERLSECHFSLMHNKGNYFIMDKGSRSGTFVNGVNILGKKWIKIASGDKIRAGGMEYRILFGRDAQHNFMQ